MKGNNIYDLKTESVWRSLYCGEYSHIMSMYINKRKSYGGENSIGYIDFLNRVGIKTSDVTDRGVNFWDWGLDRRYLSEKMREYSRNVG